MSGFTLRPEQQRVIDEYRGGYAAISAVPGAGKTTTLSALAAHLIGNIGPRQRVMIVTYQNAAVANFQRAVTQRLAEQGKPPRGFVVRTLHSLALEVLSSVRHRAELDIGARVIDEADDKQILDEMLAVAIECHRERLEGFVLDPEMARSSGWPEREDWLLGNIARAALDELRPLEDRLNELSDCSSYESGWLPFVLDIYEGYQRALRERGYLGYDDLIVRAAQVLEHDDALCRRLRARWPYLLEDEAQDSSPLQERMLRRIAGDDGNLVRVGDPNQAILTTFTASSVDGFRAWLDDPRVKQFGLAGSSRSTEVILRLANRFVECVNHDFLGDVARPDALRRQVIDPVFQDGVLQNPPSPIGARIGVDAIEFNRTEDELDDTIKQAIRYLERFPERTVAILVGGKNIGYDYALAARAEGFPDEKIIRLLSGKDGRPVGLISRLLPVLGFLERPDQTRRLTDALTAWSELGPQDRVILAVNQHSKGTPELLVEILYSAPDEGIDSRLDLPADLLPQEEQTLERLRAVPGWLENRLSQPHELLALIGATIGVPEPERELFDAIAETVGGVPPDPKVSRLEQLGSVLEELRNRHRRLRGTHDEHEISIDPGTLTISTRHQAKGLEWDVVFAVGCDDFWFRGSLDFQRLDQRDYLGPFDPVLVMKTEIRHADRGITTYPTQDDIYRTTIRQAAEEVSEGLRIMYVTITRARLAFRISWHRDGTQGKRRKQRFMSPVFPLVADLIVELREGAASVAAD